MNTWGSLDENELSEARNVLRTVKSESTRRPGEVRGEFSAGRAIYFWWERFFYTILKLFVTSVTSLSLCFSWPKIHISFPTALAAVSVMACLSPSFSIALNSQLWPVFRAVFSQKTHETNGNQSFWRS